MPRRSRRLILGPIQRNGPRVRIGRHMVLVMHVAVYDAMGAPRELVRVGTLERVDVEVSDDWTVGDVLDAAGHWPVNHFALVREDNGGVADLAHSVKFTHLLYGLDNEGRVYMAGPPVMPWRDFVSACEFGLGGDGSPAEIAVFAEGTAGDLTPDGLWELVQWIFDNRELVAKELATFAAILGSSGVVVKTTEAGGRWVNSKRKQIIARSWRKRGFNCAGVREYLGRVPQWDSKRFAAQMGLSDLESCLALTNAGYLEDPDGLWRLSNDVLPRQHRKDLDAIEHEAELSIEDGWSDDFSIEDDD